MTQAEVTSATDLIGANSTEEVFSSSGWGASDAVINAPGWASLETANVPGDITYGIGTHQWYLDQTQASNTVYDLFVTGAAGYRIFAPAGTAVGSPYEIVEVKVTRRQLDEPSNAAQSYTCAFSQQNRLSGEFAA